MNKLITKLKSIKPKEWVAMGFILFVLATMPHDLREVLMTIGLSISFCAMVTWSVFTVTEMFRRRK